MSAHRSTSRTRTLTDTLPFGRIGGRAKLVSACTLARSLAYDLATTLADAADLARADLDPALARADLAADLARADLARADAADTRLDELAHARADLVANLANARARAAVIADTRLDELAHARVGLVADLAVVIARADARARTRTPGLVVGARVANTLGRASFLVGELAQALADVSPVPGERVGGPAEPGGRGWRPWRPGCWGWRSGCCRKRTGRGMPRSSGASCGSWRPPMRADGVSWPARPGC